MTDFLEIQSLFEKSNFADEATYERIEYLQLADQNGQSYTDGRISYLTEPFMKNHIVLSESYLQLPITVVLGTAGRIAVKNSLLSLISSVQIDSSAGTSIVGETTLSTPIIANLKLLIDSSTDFLDGNSLQFFGKDTYSEPAASGQDLALVGTVDPRVTACVTGVPPVLSTVPYRNVALSSRISVFATVASAIAAGLQSYVAYIPLHFIHSFFKVMDFPMINLSLRITFGLSGVGQYSNYQPYTIPTFPAVTTTGVASTALTTSALSLSALIPAAVITSAGVVPSLTDKYSAVITPKLFLKAVYFRAEEAMRLKREIEKGFTRELTYTVSQLYPMSQTQAGPYSLPFAPGVIRPTRLWVMPVKTGTLSSSANTFPSSIGPYYLTNFNLQLNGNNFYQNQFITQYQFYREFKTQCIAASSSQAAHTPISFADWVSGCNPYVFDLSRNPTVKSNNMCSMTIATEVRTIGSNVAPAAFDLLVVVERLQTLTLKVSVGGVEMTCRQGAD